MANLKYDPTLDPIYLSGPMTIIPGLNYPSFFAKAEELRLAGYVVKNPAEFHSKDASLDSSLPYLDCIHAALLEMQSCKSIALLDGWKQSTGSRMELLLAEKWKMRIVSANDLSEIQVVEFPSIRKPGLSVLEEAEYLVTRSRGPAYDVPTKDYGRAVGAFNALTGHYLSIKEGIIFMLCVKLSREVFRHSRDGTVDLAGYTRCLTMHEEVLCGEEASRQRGQDSRKEVPAGVQEAKKDEGRGNRFINGDNQHIQVRAAVGS